MNDFGRDSDSEIAAGIVAFLSRNSHVDVLSVVACLYPAVRRAQLAKGMFESFNLATPVTIGSDIRGEDRIVHDHEFANAPYASEHVNHHALRQFIHTARTCPDKQLDLVLSAGLTDFANVLLNDKGRSLVSKKVRHVTFMGGVEFDGDRPLLRNDLLVAERSAANNDFDYPAAHYVYKTLQQLGISITIVSRFAAKAAPINRIVIDDMAATGHPVGLRIQHAARDAIQNLWQRVHLPATDVTRHLPPRCDPDWFRNDFLGGDGTALGPDDDIWPYVQSLNEYDSCAFLASMEPWRERFMSPTQFVTNGTAHHIVGLSPQQNGIRDPEGLKQFLHSASVAALLASLRAPELHHVRTLQKHMEILDTLGLPESRTQVQSRRRSVHELEHLQRRLAHEHARIAAGSRVGTYVVELPSDEREFLVFRDGVQFGRVRQHRELDTTYYRAYLEQRDNNGEPGILVGNTSELGQSVQLVIDRASQMSYALGL